MQRKSMLNRIFACVLILSFALTLVATSAVAETAVAASTTPAVADSSLNLHDPATLAAAVAQDNNKTLVVAQNSESETKAAATQSKSGNCCGNFWEVHFGGYRWIWWTLAGVGLIAIHAN